MRSVAFSTAALVLFCATSGVLAQKQIQLVATITDPSGKEVAELNPADVRVTENGAAATIVSVAPVARVPKVQILIDNGLGIPSGSLSDLRNGVRALLEALPPGLEVTIVTTAPQPRFLERPTTDRAKLLQSVDRLAPDSGTGRFAESLFEATERIDKDKQEDASYTIVMVGTKSGDSDVRERDVQRTIERVQQRRTMVHVVLLNVAGASAAGVLQGELGQILTNVSGGRFENINVANRLATLLPEIGAEMAKTLGAGSRQFRITIERPGGASGNLGEMGLGVLGKVVASVALERK